MSDRGRRGKRNGQNEDGRRCGQACRVHDVWTPSSAASAVQRASAVSLPAIRRVPSRESVEPLMNSNSRW